MIKCIPKYGGFAEPVVDNPSVFVVELLGKPLTCSGFPVVNVSLVPVVVLFANSVAVFGPVSKAVLLSKYPVVVLRFKLPAPTVPEAEFIYIFAPPVVIVLFVAEAPDLGV